MVRRTAVLFTRLKALTLSANGRGTVQPQNQRAGEHSQVAAAPTDVRSLARQQTAFAVRRLTEIARDSESDGAAVNACIALLDRGWGKAPQAITGENGEGDVRVVIRHIVRGVVTDERPLQIEHVPIVTGGE